MKNLSLLIKPVSGNCNMSCGYCFYHDIMESRLESNRGIMDYRVLERIISQALEEADCGVDFAFQGGEPTLAGLDFYKEVIRLQKEHNQKGLRIQNSLQTNGLLLDDAWCAFLHDHHFLVGLSMDGYEALHDANRKDNAGHGTYARVRQAADLLQRFRVDTNILCVVTNNAAKRGKALYRFFREEGFRYLQFVPCLDRLGSTQGTHAQAVSPAQYGIFLSDVFDCWHEDFLSGEYISIRSYDNWIRMLMGQAPETCSMSGTCVCYGCIEADGDVYPCDFYVLDEWALGNIRTSSFSEILEGQRAQEFLSISRQVPQKCRTCWYYPICRNGCRRNRKYTNTEQSGVNELCAAYTAFFSRSFTRMSAVAKTLAKKV